MARAMIARDAGLRGEASKHLLRLSRGESCVVDGSTDDCRITWKIPMMSDSRYFVFLEGDEFSEEWFAKAQQQVQQVVSPFFPDAAKVAIRLVDQSKQAWLADRRGERLDNSLDIPMVTRQLYSDEYRIYAINTSAGSVEVQVLISRPAGVASVAVDFMP